MLTLTHFWEGGCSGSIKQGQYFKVTYANFYIFSSFPVPMCITFVQLVTNYLYNN